MVDSEEPIDDPAVLRTALFAFAVWTAHFMVAYGAALIFPEQPLARWIAVVALLVAAVALVWRARRMKTPRARLALAAIGIAFVAIMFGTFPAVLG